MIVSEDGSEVLRIKLTVCSIPLFRIDVPSSSKSVRFAPELTGAKPDYHVEVAEVFGPPDLTPGENLGRSEVLKVLVVRDNVDRKGAALEVVTPNGEGIEDGEQLLVVRVVVEFRGTEGPGPERNRVDFAVVSGNGQDGSNGVIGGVRFDGDLSIRKPVVKDGRFQEGALEGIEGILAVVGPLPFDARASQASKRHCNR